MTSIDCIINVGQESRVHRAGAFQHTYSRRQGTDLCGVSELHGPHGLRII